jgi:hypothetical protein
VNIECFFPNPRCNEADAQDPYAGIRDLLYIQKPESREAEIRSERNRARATAFLQAFGTISDAFTLSRGGDVAKRDMNPYILNHMQKAAALGEQDRADKKAWENSLLNLENNIAQYNVRQQELSKQRAWDEAKSKEAQEFQIQMRTLENDDRLKAVSHQYDLDDLADKNRSDRAAERMREEYKLRTDLSVVNNRADIVKESIRQRGGTDRERLRQEGREVVESIKAASQSNPSSSPYLSIKNPNNPSEKIGIDENDTLALFGCILRDIDNYEDEMENILPFREGRRYSNEEAKRAVIFFAAKHPDITLEYFGEIGRQTGTATQAAPATQQQTSQFQPQQAAPYQQGQGPVAGYYQQQTQPAQTQAPAAAQQQSNTEITKSKFK